jgi:hypothetical protein
LSKGGSTVKTTQSSTSAVDPATQRYVNMMRDRATQGMNELQGVGPMQANPALMQALQGLGGIQGGGALPSVMAPSAGGVNADTMSLMNPFMQGVVDPTRAEFDHLRGLASVGANQQATGAGAFGGSRHGVMQGTRLGELDRGQASQIAQMLMGGFNNAQQGAFRLGDQSLTAAGINSQNAIAGMNNNLQAQMARAQMGLQGAGMLQGIDQYNAQLPFMRQQAMQGLGMGSIGPYGQTSTGSATQRMPGPDPFSQLLGLGATVGSFFLPGMGARPQVPSSAMPMIGMGPGVGGMMFG